MKNGPLQAGQPQVKHTPNSDSQAVRVDGAIVSLQANNLAQDLLLSHRAIAGCASITPQDEGEPTAVSFLYIHDAMGKKIILQTIEDNVSLL
jgi:hypothetical protein